MTDFLNLQCFLVLALFLACDVMFRCISDRRPEACFSVGAHVHARRVGVSKTRDETVGCESSVGAY